MIELPDGLRPHAQALTAALNTPILGEWPEGVAYSTADQPAAVARKIIPLLHEELKRAKIAYLYRENLGNADRIKLGTASKASAKITFLTDYDFLIEFNWTQYRGLSSEQRIALIDHELCHCAVDTETEKYVLRHHDVEEFGEIVRRWGLWKPDLSLFAEDMRHALQHELRLEPAGA